MRQIGLLSVLLWALIGCSDKEQQQTGIRVIIDSDIGDEARIASVQVQVFAPDGVAPLRELVLPIVHKPDGDFPKSVLLRSPGNEATEFRFVIRGRGMLHDDSTEMELVRHEVFAQFRPGRTSILNILLSRACLQRFCEEAANLTCNPSSGDCIAVQRIDLPSEDVDAGATDSLDSSVGPSPSPGDADATQQDAAEPSPLLADMSTNGTLAPPFSPTHYDYRIRLGLGTSRPSITAVAPGGSTLTVNGLLTASGAPTVMEPLFLGASRLAEVIVGRSSDRTSATTYSVSIAREVVESHFFKADVPKPSGYGRSVAVREDILVIGAPSEDSQSGAVYVYARQDGRWSQTHRLTAHNAEAGDGFGSSIAISRDLIVVGAPLEDGAIGGVNPSGEDNAAPAAGAVYAFVRIGTEWVQRAYIKPDMPGTDGNFGGDVAVFGNTIVAGRIGEQAGFVAGAPPNFGAAYVFEPSGGVWVQHTKLKPPAAAVVALGSVNAFGASVSIDGDVLAVGAPRSGAASRGAVFVFRRSGTTWLAESTIAASNAGAGDYFGQSVCLSGRTLAIGAIGEASLVGGVNTAGTDNSGTFAGAAYVFEYEVGAWSQRAYLKAHNPSPQDRFGTRVSVRGDIVAVGSPNESSDGTGIDPEPSDDLASSGAIYIFERKDGVWAARTFLKASNPDASDQFGYGFGWDGIRLAVGSWSEGTSLGGVDNPERNPSDNSAAGSGAVYMFE